MFVGEELETQKNLNLITSNTQYLTHIFHILENTNVEFESQKAYPICLDSVQKSVVQFVYLTYTCCCLSVDIYVRLKPELKKRQFSDMRQVYYEFFLANELKKISTKIKEKKLSEFTLLELAKGQKYYNVMGLNKILTITEQNLLILGQSKTNGINNEAIKRLQQFQNLIKNYLKPLSSNDSTVLIIQQLQKSALLLNNSDLLIIQNNSLFYKIKEDQQVLKKVKQVNHQLKSTFLQFRTHKNKNSQKIYQMIDKLFVFMIKNKVLYMKKSFNNENKDKDGLQAGFCQQTVVNQEKKITYMLEFYTIESTPNQKGLQQMSSEGKNKYFMQYNFDDRYLCLKYLSDLEANLTTIDIISNYCSNICFLDKNIIIETIPGEKSSNKSQQTKKFVAFKSIYRFQQFEWLSPIIPMLLLIQYISVCAKIYLPVLKKIPEKNMTKINQHMIECSHRVQHALKIIGMRADTFYCNL